VAAGKSGAQPQARFARVKEKDCSVSDEEEIDYLAITVADAPGIVNLTFPSAAAAATASTAAGETSGGVQSAAHTFTAEEQALMRELDFSSVANTMCKTMRAGRTHWCFQVYEGCTPELNLYGELLASWAL
jgi:hypothetical protein